MGCANQLDLAQVAKIISQIERGGDNRRDVRLQERIFRGMPGRRVSLGGTAEHHGSHLEFEVQRSVDILDRKQS